MIEKAAILRHINVYDEYNDLNVDVEEQWDLRSCMPCMHPGIVDQTDKREGVIKVVHHWDEWMRSFNEQFYINLMQHSDLETI